MTNNNEDMYINQRRWLCNICDEIVKYSETIEKWTFEKEGARWKIAFWNEKDEVLFYKSGKFSSVRTDLRLILYGLMK